MKRVYVSLIANFDRKNEVQCVGVGFDNDPIYDTFPGDEDDALAYLAHCFERGDDQQNISVCMGAYFAKRGYELDDGTNHFVMHLTVTDGDVHNELYKLTESEYMEHVNEVKTAAMKTNIEKKFGNLVSETVH